MSRHGKAVEYRSPLAYLLSAHLTGGRVDEAALSAHLHASGKVPDVPRRRRSCPLRVKHLHPFVAWVGDQQQRLAAVRRPCEAHEVVAAAAVAAPLAGRELRRVTTALSIA